MKYIKIYVHVGLYESLCICINIIYVCLHKLLGYVKVGSNINYHLLLNR